MAFPIPTPSLLISALVAISAVSVTARELRPSDHGLEYQDNPSSPTSNPKPTPGMLSFFGASTSPPSAENAGGGIPKEADSSDLSMNSPEKHDHVKDVLLVASLACGAAGVALLMASGLLFLFKYKKDRIGSGNARSLAVTRPMQPPSLSPTQKLEGKVALIIGGASGIGKTTASMFVEHGAMVVIADVQDELGISFCQEFGSVDSVLYIHCNVSNDNDDRNTVDMTVSKYRKLNIMYIGDVNSRILESTDEDFKQVLDFNLLGTYLGAKHAARVMIPAKGGSILFTASMCTVCSSGPCAYMASEHGIVGMAKNLALEVGAHGIRVNCISPFGVATPMLKNALGMEDTKKVEEVVSAIANSALYLASDESKYVSGINLVVDGGFSNTSVSFGAVLSLDGNI